MDERLLTTHAGADGRPFPPGDYPVVVVGSGPGGLQLSYALRQLGVRHAMLSGDESPGGMFRRWPFFQRLLSWTKPYAPARRGSRAYERYDWNSLIADDEACCALQPEFMDQTSEFPSRPEMEANLAAFAERTGLAIRHGVRWTGTRAIEEGRYAVETTDGEYRADAVVFAIGVAEPYMPPTPGIEQCDHYASVRSAETYAGRRVFIIGKQNSGFELANGFLPWAQRIVLASPSPAKLSVVTKSLVGVRARYVQPYEDHVLGGGVSVLDASIDRVDRDPDGTLVVRARPSDGGPELAIEADDVIAATGFVAPLQDLPALGVMTFGQSRLPAQTPYWESSTVPGIYFAGTITQGATGLKKHGLPSNSGAVHGARYNARVLAAHIAATRFGIAPARPEIAPRELVDFLLEEAATGPELWHQKAYLARVVTVDAADGIRDEGILPLAGVLDDGGRDAVIMTIEADGTGAVNPVVYLRREGAIEEHALEGHPFLDFATPGHHRQLGELVEGLVGDVGARAK